MTIEFRPASMDDADLLLGWRNDPLTCAMSKTPAQVARPDHVAWLAARLARTDPGLYVAQIDGKNVGTLRVDGDEVSYTVAPDQRGAGIATAMLIEARGRFGVLRAEIFEDNAASIRAAEKAGMRVVILNR
jgi:RimJ/RimL family protein N-acetyltransferase